MADPKDPKFDLEAEIKKINKFFGVHDDKCVRCGTRFGEDHMSWCRKRTESWDDHEGAYFKDGEWRIP